MSPRGPNCWSSSEKEESVRRLPYRSLETALSTSPKETLIIPFIVLRKSEELTGTLLAPQVDPGTPVNKSLIFK
jgi:hypothetical protein